MSLLAACGVLLFFVAAAAVLAAGLPWLRRRRIRGKAQLEQPLLLARARLQLQHGRPEDALALARSVALRAWSKRLAYAAWHLVAWAELALGRPRAARTALSRIPERAVDVYALAAVESALGRCECAIEALEAARSAGRAGVPALKLLIDSYARLGSYERACAVAQAAVRALDPADTRRVIAAALEQNCAQPATELAAALFQATGEPEDAAIHADGEARISRLYAS